jgi:urea transport system ATP-binding protein
LSHGQKQWLKIGIGVVSDADLLLLDEPAASMSQVEATQTAELIRRLADWHSLLVIDHDMAFIAQLDAPGTDFHTGRLLREGTLEDTAKIRKSRSGKSARLPGSAHRPWRGTRPAF